MYTHLLPTWEKISNILYLQHSVNEQNFEVSMYYRIVFCKIRKNNNYGTHSNTLTAVYTRNHGLDNFW